MSKKDINLNEIYKNLTLEFSENYFSFQLLFYFGLE